MRKHTLQALTLLAMSLLIINCSKDKDSSRNYNGTWAGTTSQGKLISFTVSGTKVKDMSISYSLSGNCYHSGGLTIFYQSYPISGNSFSISESTNISGTFLSGNSASGTFSVISGGNPSGCTSTASGTWTANK